MKRSLGYLTPVEKKILQSFIEELKRNLGNEIVNMVLFGSRVRGDFNEESDIDIFILVRERTMGIREKIGDVTADYIFDYDIPLSPVVYDLFEYQKNKELQSFFLENVEREGIAL
ncbi:MAG: nucleotidyltransferase domain-containing protein [Desulfobacterales bacterium]|nr:nucleotidyltransferase domain-containing protein [Pseudomonadota bacterium]MCK4728554.1 nucleotidyltransferase domain-containing protein [Desulfobacterales bacterium]